MLQECEGEESTILAPLDSAILRKILVMLSSPVANSEIAAVPADPYPAANCGSSLHNLRRFLHDAWRSQQSRRFCGIDRQKSHSRDFQRLYREPLMHD